MSKTQEQELKMQLTNDFITKWEKKPHFLNTVLLAKQLPCAISLRLSSTPTRLPDCSLPNPRGGRVPPRHSDISCTVSPHQSP